MADTAPGRRPRMPLLRGALWWGPRQGPWFLLVLLVFTVLAAASAAAPMFAEASENAAFEQARAAVPAGARSSDTAAVRLTGSASPSSADQREIVDDLRDVPGLTAPVLNGKSVGVELARAEGWESYVGTAAGEERARLFALPDPQTHLVTADGGAGRARDDGVWLPEPLARQLGVTTGDRVEILSRGGQERRVDATVAGTYRVAEDGRRPADRPGSGEWSLRRGELPADSIRTTLPAYLVIGDVATTERLAEAVADQLLWSVDATLAPGLTLAEATAVAEEVDDLRRRYVRGRAENEVLARRLASGIGDLTEQATEVAGTVQRRTQPLEWAAVLVALISLVAVAVAALRRRDVEIRHAAGAGLPPPLVGLLWAVEHLLAAVLGAGLGWWCAWALVAQVGPAGAVTALSLRPGLLLAAVSVLLGVVLVGVVAGAGVAYRVRPSAPATGSRRIPWLPLLVVAAVTATAGLAGSDGTGGDSRGLDLFVPLLVFAAAGALGAALLPVSLGRRWRRSGAPRRSMPRPSAFWFARRRLAAAVPGRAPVVVSVTAGLGMLLFALSAVASTRASIEDRVAVRSGAEVVAAIDGSWQLDDDPVPEPPPPASGEPAAPDGLVPGVRTPTLPARTTLVWRADVTDPRDFGTRDLLIVDPPTFAGAALWGDGPELAQARRTVDQLAAAQEEAARDPGRARITPLPAVAVGASDVGVGDRLLLDAGGWRGQVEIVAVTEVFPGLGRRPMYVVPALPAFTKFGVRDPRLEPRSRLRTGLFTRTELWGASDRTVDRVLTARAVQPQQVETADQVRRRDVYVAAAQAGRYQVAVGAYLAVLAVLALCVYAHRRAAADRPTDLMLARVGFGRSRVVVARAVEQFAVAVVASLGAVAGLLVLRPLAGRLLDVAPGESPVLRLVPAPSAIVVTAVVALLAATAASLLGVPRAGRSEEEAYRGDA